MRLERTAARARRERADHHVFGQWVGVGHAHTLTDARGVAKLVGRECKAASGACSYFFFSPMHHRCLKVRMKISPLEIASEELVCSPGPSELVGQHLVLRAGGEDQRVAVAHQEVEPARRRGPSSPRSAPFEPRLVLPEVLAGLQLVAVRHAVLVDHVDVFADDHAGADALVLRAWGAARAGPW